MLAQRLRHRINIQAVSIAEDPDSGAQTEQWETIIEDEPAEFIAQSGREFIQSAAMQDQIFGRFVIRKVDNINPKMRIQFEGACYQITAVLPDPTSLRHLTLMVNTGVVDEAVQEGGGEDDV